jgi:hypothetical protein
MIADNNTMFFYCVILCQGNIRFAYQNIKKPTTTSLLRRCVIMSDSNTYTERPKKMLRPKSDVSQVAERYHCAASCALNIGDLISNNFGKCGQ